MSPKSLPVTFPVDDSLKGAHLALLELNGDQTGSIYCLTFSSPPDNRLTPSFIRAWLDALDFVERELPNTSVLITTSDLPKFFSNGFNLDLVLPMGNLFMRDMFNRLMIRLLTFPIPTVAVINGHCFAAGFMTAMAHDYRIMNGSKGWCCLNEVEFGAELSPGMASIFKQKLDARVFRSIVLEGHRFTGPQSLEAGIVDGLGGMPEAVKLIEERKLVGKGGTDVYGRLRDEMYRETIALLQRHGLAGTQRDEAVKNGLPSWSKL